MSEQKVWPSKALADDVLRDVAGVRAYVAGIAHTLRGDELKPAQAALVSVVGQLDELAASLRARLGVPSALGVAAVPKQPTAEPGSVTAEVVRRMRGNRGAHRSGQ